MKYEVIELENGGQIIQRNDGDNKVSFIPLDEGNSDYQRYLRWLENPDAEEGGTL